VFDNEQHLYRQRTLPVGAKTGNLLLNIRL
jgi:hypothetical protein